MRKAKKIQVGSVIQFPWYQFEPSRSGWNGWMFRAGIVEKLYVNSKGRKCATVRYCSNIADRYQMLPNTEATKNIYQEYLFEFNVDLEQKNYKRCRALEKEGQKVCWGCDTALLVNHGIITE
ncbi:hypothetical protein [Selenomonas sp. AB3002]|uniref:hypothetical protein n=1 Tax=Selenomonas sp. AB3002 TaxID=1392502 RepID=UPI0004965445